MSSLGRILRTALNPRVRLGDLPWSGGPSGETPGFEETTPRSRVRLRDIALNGPLVFGGVVVVGLFLAVLFGPIWAPSNPYISGQFIVTHYDAAKGEWIDPPLPPSAEYPLGTNEWGQDILSMLLFGARTTLIACAFIAMIRVILGLGLGAYAGWNEGGLIDQFTMGTIGLFTAVPMLISGMILIYVLDIRRGLPVFIVALAIIGWTEIAQYIRGEFLVLRRMPFIEGARAVGATSFAIVVRHMIPNLMPQLLVITFLELGAVLLILGELSFIGVFIGGGSHIALGDEITGIQVTALSDIPEWGAMLADGYRWLQAKPFIVFPPAIAFFVAVVGFNAFGEGLRRLVEKNHLNTNFLLRRRMVLVIVALSLATIFIINNTGPAPWFSRLARAFDGRSAYDHAQTLTEISDRAPGHPGEEVAAAYIADRFAEYGLRPGWRLQTYIRPMETRLVQTQAPPRLGVRDSSDSLVREYRHQLDYGYLIDGHGGSGEAQAPLTFVGFQGGSGEYDWESFRGLDLRGRIVLLFEGNAPAEFATEAALRGAQGVLWVAEAETLEIPSQNQLSDPEGRYLIRPTLPIFRLKPSVAEEILAADGASLSDLFSGETAAQTGPGWFARDLDLSIEMSLDLGEPEAKEVPSVLGFIPGSDFNLAHEIVVLFTQYDGLGAEADGTQYPAANDSSAGLAVLLELARLWHEQELNPRRSILFLAWGGGQLDDPGLAEYLLLARSFSHLPGKGTPDPFTPVAVFEIQQAGAGGETLAIPDYADPRLKSAVEESASLVDIQAQFFGEGENIGSDEIARLPRIPWISLGWSGGAVPADQDVLERIDTEKLQAMGEILSHALTRLVREARY